MDKIAFSEIELAQRWGISPKTLQRWRTKARGPRYFKLSKRVVYPLDEIQTFEYEALHESTWEKADDVIPTHLLPWLSARQVAHATSLPMYVLTHPQVRESLGIPHARVGRLIRLRLDEVMAWARRWTAENAAAGIEVPAEEQRRTLLKALASLPA